jgi:diguanylate cyclase (GGDEF)-like protein
MRASAAEPASFAVVVSARNAKLGRGLCECVREALPAAAVTLAPTAAEGLERAALARQTEGAARLVVLDARVGHLADMVADLQQIRRLGPQAEVVIVADAEHGEAFAAALAAGLAPDKLTFLTAPLVREDAVNVCRTIGERLDAAEGLRRSHVKGRSDAKAMEIQLQELRARLDIANHAARHDALTGVLNRTGFIEELNARLHRSRQAQVVLMLDLDRFKAVNDTLGHGAGDDLVRRICVAVAAVIPTSGVLARLGGDEFGLVLEAMSAEGVDNLCTQILKVCNQTRVISGHEVQVSASIGVAMQNRAFSDVELLRQADLALYAAKREGRNRYRIFDAALDKATKYRLSIENGLERALRSAQFRMVYQPIVTARDAEIVGYEALVRWESPEYGMISPAEFVPIAEETGMILEIGEWIARQALKDCRRWNGPYVSINLSARQFLRHNVAERLLKYAADANVPPQRIQIELTETAIIDDVTRAANNLKIMREAGMRVAIDDFGTGYSSLSYLNQFAIDCIKIDKSFVDRITRDRQSAIIVASVAKLARSLGISVVAEGVETDAQRMVLTMAGCEMLQGYLFGKPISSRELIELAEPLRAAS